MIKKKKDTILFIILSSPTIAVNYTIPLTFLFFKFTHAFSRSSSNARHRSDDAFDDKPRCLHCDDILNRNVRVRETSSWYL